MCADRFFDADGFFAAFAAMQWGADEAHKVAAALSYAAKHCTASSAISIRLEGNQFGREGQEVIEKAIISTRGRGKVFQGVIF